MMELHLALIIGLLYGTSLYLMLRRSLVKLVFGLAVMGHASNLLILTMGRITRARVPIMDADKVVLTLPYADPVPQALILTAIVIGLGVQAFALILVHRVHEVLATHDLDRLNTTDT